MTNQVPSSRNMQPAGSLSGATVYLAEEGRTLDDLIGDPATERVELDPGHGLNGTLLVGRYEATTPDWVAQLATITRDALPRIETQMAGAALLVELAGRWFALTFGQGRHLLRLDAFVEDFGLRVAANTVDPNRVRSVDGRRFERGVIMTRRQGSQPSRPEGLGLQVDRELLAAIAGRSRRVDEGRIHGRKSLGTSRDVDLGGLDGLARSLLADYGDTAFRDGFPTLNRIIPEARTSPTARRLDDELVRALTEPGARGAYLAPPAILDWERVQGFRFASLDARTERREEVTLDDYLTLQPAPSLVDLGDQELGVVDRGSMRVTDRWPIRNWLVWETELDGGAYVLSDGLWYRVDGEYLARINSAAGRVGAPGLAMPVPSRANLAEAVVNGEFAAALNGVLLDRQLAQVGTERGRFELCDVFVPPDKLLHVKRGIGSQELSYLFAQGATSAEGLRFERPVRERFQQLVTDRAPQLGNVIPIDGRLQAGSFEVVFVVVDEGHRRVPRDIPFFARASLARAVQTLDDLEFRYSAIGVPDGP